MLRPNLDSYWLSMLPLVAARATCPRRAVGAILTDKDGCLVSTGYNGNSPGAPHCLDIPCSGSPVLSGFRDDCEALHAESNVIAQALGSRRAPYTLYCSVTPCFPCAKLLLACGVRRVVALEYYMHDDRGPVLLKQNGVEVIVLSKGEDLN